MKMREILATPIAAMKKKERKPFIILSARDEEEEEDDEVEKFLCARCEKNTEGKDFCSGCGLKRNM